MTPKAPLGKGIAAYRSAMQAQAGDADRTAPDRGQGAPLAGKGLLKTGEGPGTPSSGDDTPDRGGPFRKLPRVLPGELAGDGAPGDSRIRRVL